MRGLHNGKISGAVEAMGRCDGEISAAWLSTTCELTKKQAENAITYAKRRQFLQRTGVGRYRWAGRAA